MGVRDPTPAVTAAAAPPVELEALVGVEPRAGPADRREPPDPVAAQAAPAAAAARREPAAKVEPGVLGVLRQRAGLEVAREAAALVGPLEVVAAQVRTAVPVPVVRLVLEALLVPAGPTLRPT